MVRQSGYKELMIRASQPVYIFGLSLPMMYAFATKVSQVLLGPLDGYLSFFDYASIFIIWETGLLIGCAYATLLWLLTMKFFLTPQEIEAHLSHPYMPFISEGVNAMFRLVFGKKYLS
jgi:hypothetical protein